MRCEVKESEDTTTLYLRWEIFFEGKEVEFLKALGGPVALALDAQSYIDVGGKFHEQAEVEVLIYPHAGPRNFGQAKFSHDYESRRSFWERLQAAITGEVTSFVYDTEPGSLDVEGHVIRLDSTIA